MRFNFSSQISEARNFLSSQLADTSGSLFPPSEGWKMVHPSSFFAAQDKTQNFIFFHRSGKIICFLLADKDFTVEKTARLKPRKIEQRLINSQLKFNALEVIIVSSTENLSEATFVDAANGWNYPILVFEYGKFYFKKGAFKDKALHARFDRGLNFKSFFSSSLLLPEPPRLPDREEIIYSLRKITESFIGFVLAGRTKVSWIELVGSIFPHAQRKKDALKEFSSEVMEHLEGFAGRALLKSGQSCFTISKSAQTGEITFDLKQLSETEAMKDFISAIRNEAANSWRLNKQLNLDD